MKKLCLFGVFFMATLGMPAQSETVVLLGGHMSHIENTNNLKVAIRAFIKLC